MAIWECIMSQNIQWYPGHMFKTLKQMTVELKHVDVVMVLLDARIPISSFNPLLETHVKQKHVLYVLTKKDLADKDQTNRFMLHLKKEDTHVIAINALEEKSKLLIHKSLDTLMASVQEKRIAKGLKKKVYRVMIAGIPNVGKSTLINTLSSKKVAKTGNMPGVTKHLQWTKMSDTAELLDSPGMLWPKFEDPIVALHLALTGAIKDDILPLYDVCEYGIQFMLTHYKARLYERYELTSDEDVIRQIATKRGALLKNNEIDELRVYHIFLQDLRSGKLGGVTFDRL
jgi:ribosome biogenesis GTPase A